MLSAIHGPWDGHKFVKQDLYAALKFRHTTASEVYKAFKRAEKVEVLKKWIEAPDLDEYQRWKTMAWRRFKEEVTNLADEQLEEENKVRKQKKKSDGKRKKEKRSFDEDRDRGAKRSKRTITSDDLDDSSSDADR